MGFATGKYLLNEVIEAVRHSVKVYKTREKIYTSIIGKFESEDCDIEACYGICPFLTN